MTVFTSQSGALTRIIDGGSGYLCEMEPVAHFGLGDFLLNVVDTEKTSDTSQVNTRTDCWPNSFFL